MTIKAIYSNGVLKPLKPLPLDENQTVEIQVTKISEATPKTKSLFGAFPALAAFSHEDFDWAKRMWEHDVEKQSRTLDGLN
jgi:predicted DNA-binding antitoxin AbrB/MazE fold protein